MTPAQHMRKLMDELNREISVQDAPSVLMEGYKEVKQKYVSTGIPDNEVDKIFSTFKSLVDRNQVQGDERNIDWWGKKPFGEFKQFVNLKSEENSKTQIKRSKIPGKSINLIDNKDWLVVIPLDKNASCFHGKGSDWCTTKPHENHFEKYFYEHDVILIYCLSKKDGGMWAIAAKDMELFDMFDKNDNQIGKDQFKKQTGLDAKQLVDIAFDYYPNISDSKTQYKDAIKRLKFFDWSKLRERNHQIEKDLVFTQSNIYSLEYLRILEDKVPEAIQLAAVKQNGYAIEYINNPSEAVQLAAVKQNGYALGYIKHPSEAVKLEAINKDAKAISYIRNPSEAIQLAAVAKVGNTIEYIKNPSEAVQLAAIKKNAYAIEHIKNPSEAVQLAAVKQNGHAIIHIKNPSEAVQLAAVKQNGHAIIYIKNPSEAIQLAAVKKDASAIDFVENPSEAVRSYKLGS